MGSEGSLSSTTFCRRASSSALTNSTSSTSTGVAPTGAWIARMAFSLQPRKAAGLARAVGNGSGEAQR